MNILILAAHPDDEVLGMGGTIKKLCKNKIKLCVISEGATAQYSNEKMIQVRREACMKSGKILGISSFDFFDFPDMKLDSIPQLEINKKIEKVIERFKPQIIYTTPNNDYNKDHKIVYESTLVAARPITKCIKQILSYEIPNYVKNPFEANVYENISKEFTTKIKAFKQFKSEIHKMPHPRSFEYIEALAKLRGMESGFLKAEAFRLIRNSRD